MGVIASGALFRYGRPAAGGRTFRGPLLGRVKVLDALKPNKSKMSGRAMKYPYTLGAKIAQFPVGYYIKNQWLFKYYLLGVGLSVPIFKAFQDAAMSPANVEKWAAKEH